MAQEPEQTDLSEPQPEQNFLRRFWNSKKAFRIVFWIPFSLVIILDYAYLLKFIYFPELLNENIWHYVLLAGLTIFFLIIYDLKKPHIVLDKLKSVYFWIVALSLILLAYFHYVEFTPKLYESFARKWLFTLGLTAVILILLYIKRPPVIIKTLKSKFFWLVFTVSTLIFLHEYQKEIAAQTSKFWLVPIGIVLVIGTLLAIWKIPLWLVKSLDNKEGSAEQSPFELEEKRLKLADDSRKTIATVIGGLFVVIGAVFTYSNYELSSEGQYTNRFSTAVTLLKENDPSVRLGGLYALERVAKDSPKDHPVIMEILAAYIRERSRIQRGNFEKSKTIASNKNQNLNGTQTAQVNSNPNPANNNPENYYPNVEKLEDLPAPVDVLTAIEIIRRRKVENDKEDFTFDLRNANLRGADLKNIKLDGANLSGANLSYTKLDDSNLSFSNLKNANFSYANLDYANFDFAYLQNATFIGADFFLAKLDRTSLDGANFSSAKMLSCLGLDFERIKGTIIDKETTLPDYIEPRRDELMQLSPKNLYERQKNLETQKP